MRVTVVGLGYVGLVTSACLAEWGNEVVGIDASQARLKSLSDGNVPFHEPGLDELVAREAESGRLTYGGPEAIPATVAASSAVVIAVGTHDGNGGWQTETLLSCLAQVVPHMAEDAVLVVRSTMPPHLAGQLRGITSQLRREVGLEDIAVVVNPEFTREGTALNDFREPERVVLGIAHDPMGRGEALVQELYAGVACPKLVMSATDATLTKLAANLFLATKISFANEVARLCETFDATIDNVVEGLIHDPRMGRGFLGAGVGFGGSCLPHQVSMTYKSGAERGLELPLLAAVDSINRSQRDEFVDRVVAALEGVVAGRRICLLGLSFKPYTDDLRDAPSLSIARLLIDLGAQVVAYDPMPGARARAAELIPRLRITVDAEGAITGSDVVGLVTEWPEFVSLDWQRVNRMMRGDAVIDGRNCLVPAEVRAAGLRYIGFGRGNPGTSVAVPIRPARGATEANAGRRDTAVGARGEA